jgi:xyloglucan:xyloglucosyl transferase
MGSAMRGSSQWGLGGAVMAVMCVSMVVGGEAGLADLFNTWQPRFVSYWYGGRGVTLTLAEGESAAGAGSKESWLFGSVGAWVKLPGGDAAGTVATLYLSSPFPNQCEFDFEFLGHLAGRPRKIHTNVFVDGVGGMEQQIYMPGDFDPTAAYHYYSFGWHKDMVVFYVDWKPIRMFKNLEGVVPGFKYCNHKPMSLFFSIWDGSNWATEGGSIPVDWNAAPFRSKYSDFVLDACKVASWDQSGIYACQQGVHATGPGVTPEQWQYMEGIKNNASLVAYNYCTDYNRYPKGSRPECQYNAM